MSVELSLLTWNIDQWPRGVPPLHKERRLAQVRAALDRFDVVCLQECWSERALGLRDALPHHHADDLRSRFDYGSGLLTLSRFPVRRTAQERFRHAAFPDSMAAKGMILTTVEVPGFGPLDVVNTHLQARHQSQVRRRQARQLAAFVHEHRNGAPLVLAGDLNARRDSTELRQLTASLEPRDVLQERPLRAGADDTAPRFHGGEERIDHLLLLADETRVEVLETGVVGAEPAAGILASDHHGLYTRLHLSSTRPEG